MSVAVCRSSASGFESILMLTRKETVDTLPLPRLEEPAKTRPVPPPPPAHFDIWSSIQAQQQSPTPYVHHRLTRSSSSSLSQKSLEICTENLGSESGSDDFFSSDDESEFFSSIRPPAPPSQKQVNLESEEPASLKRSNSRAVNYHCSISRKSSSTPRSFPPPLPSISRRDGLCFQMRPHRKDGRLVVEAVAVPSQNYLHAERQNGRLLLSFINTTTTSHPSYNRDEEKYEQVEEEEEEVEVVDRGTMVEVKVSTQPQQQSKVHRSSIVINKFVSCTPLTNTSITNTSSSETETETETENETETTLVRPLSPVRRLQSTATTTAAAAAVAASSVSAFSEAEGGTISQPLITITTDNKLLFTSKRRNREELLHDMRRCSQLKKPLFIWEPCCIATSSS